MADEFDLELADEQDINNDKVEKRIKNLSQKVELTAKERDELAEAKRLKEEENLSLTKERDFYKDFNASSSKYPGAHEYQDSILEKVKAGYSVEDATVSVLVKEGKLNAQIQEPEAPSAAGGSASNSFSGEKKESTQEELRSALLQKLGS